MRDTEEGGAEDGRGVSAADAGGADEMDENGGAVANGGAIDVTGGAVALDRAGGCDAGEEEGKDIPS